MPALPKTANFKQTALAVPEKRVGSLWGLDYPGMEAFVRQNWGKSPTYGDALFRHIYGNSSGDKTFRSSSGFKDFLKILEKELSLPPVSACRREDNGVKFLLDLGEKTSPESVIIPMATSATLCLSSQIGCAYGCSFCATGALGFIRNLSAAEILAQYETARRLDEGKNLRNIVFMGMGEPFDNFEAVIRALDILSDERGAAIPKRRISLSTAGHIPGIRRLTELCRREPGKNYHCLHLSLSLHSGVDKSRSALMPINRLYPLGEIKKALLESPYSRRKDGLYIEYLLIPGITDTDREIGALKFFLKGLKSKINLIPYNPVPCCTWRGPKEEEVQKVLDSLRLEGLFCRIRKSKGRSIMGSCGQLGAQELKA